MRADRIAISPLGQLGNATNVNSSTPVMVAP